MSENDSNFKGLEKESLAILRQSQSEVIGDLRTVCKKLQMIKTETANRRKNLTMDDKLIEDLVLNQTLSSIVYKALLKMANMNDKLNVLERNIKVTSHNEAAIALNDRPMELVDSDESESSDETIVGGTHSSELQLLLDSLRNHNCNTEEVVEESTVKQKLARPIARIQEQNAVETPRKSPGPIDKKLEETFGNHRRKLLTHCQDVMRSYGIPMYEFTMSWASGLAFCALIHYHHPELIDESYLRCKNSTIALQYATDVARSIGVEFEGCLVRFYQQKRPSYIKVFNFVNKLYNTLISIPQPKAN